MSRALLRRASTMLMCAVVLTCPALASAQDNPEARDAARSLATRGYQRMKAGEIAEAIRLFEEADRIFHAPTIVLLLAQAHAAAGRLATAEVFYTRVIDEQIAKGAPPEFTEAKTTAAREREALRPRVPTITVHQERPSPGATARLDGKEVALSALIAGVRVDPGKHQLEITDGQARFERSIDLIESAHVVVDVALSGPAGTAEATPPSDGGSLAPSMIVLAFGVAGLAVGATTGGLALDRASTVKDRCVDGHCFAEDEAIADEAETFGTVSTVSFVVGGALVATGITLLLLRDVVDPPTTAGLPVQIVVGPTGGALFGQF